VRGDSLDDVQRIFGAVEVELQKRHSMASDGSVGESENTSALPAAGPTWRRATQKSFFSLRK
jgi:hypothetical protein